MNIRDYNLKFNNLSARARTDLLVIHHTGERDLDASAEQIHDWHLNQGWAGIGYHFVIRKDGTIEIGRPEWAIGSHAYGFNDRSIGIHLSGDFQTAQPTAAQINSCAELVRELADDYEIPLHRGNIKGHCDLMSTDCPGKNLYSRLDEIISKAQNFDDEIKSAAPIEDIFSLAAKFESDNNCGAIGHGYGLFQFSKTTLREFIGWLKDYPDKALANYGGYLANADDLNRAWKFLADVDPGHFSQLQREFTKKFFYDAAAELLVRECFHAEKHSLNLQAVIFARAVQHGVFGSVELFKRACPYPNLSYADDKYFDRTIIAAVYDYLIENPNFTTQNSKLHAALISRFAREKEAALA